MAAHVFLAAFLGCLFAMVATRLIIATLFKRALVSSREEMLHQLGLFRATLEHELALHRATCAIDRDALRAANDADLRMFREEVATSVKTLVTEVRREET